MKKPKFNSDRQSKLAAKAKELGLRMPQVQLLLAQERYLERMASIPEAKCMVWKGGSLLLRRYSALKPPRFTTDIDLLIRGTTVEDAVNSLKKASSIELHDGFNFELTKTNPMKRETPYGGERFEFSWTFEGRKNSEPLKIDICAGDDVDIAHINLKDVFIEAPQIATLSIQLYPPEFIFAEKLETLVRFGTGNTRLKDFIDLWTLTKGDLESRALKSAIIRCFERRGTTLTPRDWEEVLKNRELEEIFETQMRKHFSNLNLPKIQIIFSEILDFLEKMTL